MKAKWGIWLLLACMFFTASSLADGYSHWTVSQFNGYVQFASYTGDYDGWVDISGYGGVTLGERTSVQIISRNASIWAQPKTNSKKLGTAKHGQQLSGVPLDTNGDGSRIVEQSGFYAVNYNGQVGWVNSAYAVHGPFEIVLMEGNVPAYCAPDTGSKKVGSLNKLTRYTVLGFYEDFYVVSLREAAAYIPMSVKHYDTSFERMYHAAMQQKLTVNRKTTMRTGPGEEYASVRDVKAGAKMSCWDTLNGWCLVWDDDNAAYTYIWSGDVKLEWP